MVAYAQGSEVGLKKQNWLQRKIEPVTSAPQAYVEKAAAKFETLDLHKQCDVMLSILKVQRFMPINRRQVFLKGFAEDYQRESNNGAISVDEWLKPFRTEPLFEKILKTINVSWEQLENYLKTGGESK